MTDVPAGGHGWRVAQGPGAFAHARDLAREALEKWGWPPERIEVVVLLVSELVTNAHRHAGTDAWLHLHPMADGVRLTVRDASPELPDRRIPDLCTTAGGFGLNLLDHFTAGWGVEKLAGGKRIWAHVLKCLPHPGN
ncbi:ATP-binding protein [Streptomyces sp. SYSU K21746]